MTPRVPSLIRSSLRVFALSLNHMLWSRRSMLLAFLLGSPVLLALAVRLLGSLGTASSFHFDLQINGNAIGGDALFGVIMWLLFVRFIVPVLGVFYGTALIADEVDDKTITYLFTRPVPRAAVLAGKYLAYLACAALLVVPSVVVVYLLIVPVGGGDLGGSFPALIADLGTLVAGLISYGALFAWVGARIRRPLVVGLVFVFGWEPTVLLLPGYLKHLTLGYYLQSLVPDAMPQESGLSLLAQAFSEIPRLASSLAWLAAITGTALILAARAVERREYVIEP